MVNFVNTCFKVIWNSVQDHNAKRCEWLEDVTLDISERTSEKLAQTHYLQPL